MQILFISVLEKKASKKSEINIFYQFEKYELIHVCIMLSWY